METPHRRIRSYVLRQGRLTRGQQHALERHWVRYGIDYRPILLDFTAVFGSDAPVTLEIGFGNGESLVTQARGTPGSHFIGIEVHRPGVGHCLHRIDEEQLENLRVINHDAIDVLRHMIAPGSIERVQLFFPDPWQKKRHHKRRILKREFIIRVHEVLVAGGCLHLATDWEDYAGHMQEEMDASGLFELAGTDRGDRPVTRFEERGLKAGHVVRDFVYRAI